MYNFSKLKNIDSLGQFPIQFPIFKNLRFTYLFTRLNSLLLILSLILGGFIFLPNNPIDTQATTITQVCDRPAGQDWQNVQAIEAYNIWTKVPDADGLLNTSNDAGDCNFKKFDSSLGKLTALNISAYKKELITNYVDNQSPLTSFSKLLAVSDTKILDFNGNSLFSFHTDYSGPDVVLPPYQKVNLPTVGRSFSDVKTITDQNFLSGLTGTDKVNFHIDNTSSAKYDYFYFSPTINGTFLVNTIETSYKSVHIVFEYQYKSLPLARTGTVSNSMCNTGFALTNVLLGQDPDGENITKYTITSVPDALLGKLFLTGNTVSVGQDILAGDLSSLVFRPIVGSGGKSVNFEYTATNQSGLNSPVAKITINLVVCPVRPPVAVSSIVIVRATSSRSNTNNPSIPTIKTPQNSNIATNSTIENPSIDNTKFIKPTAILYPTNPNGGMITINNPYFNKNTLSTSTKLVGATTVEQGNITNQNVSQNTNSSILNPVFGLQKSSQNNPNNLNSYNSNDQPSQKSTQNSSQNTEPSLLSLSENSSNNQSFDNFGSYLDYLDFSDFSNYLDYSNLFDSNYTNSISQRTSQNSFDNTPCDQPKSDLENTLDGIAGFMDGAITGFENGIINGLDNFGEITDGIGYFIWDTGSNIAQNINDGVSGFVDWFSSAKDSVDKKTNGIYNSIGSGIDGVNSYFGDVATKTASVIGNNWNDFSSSFDSFGKGIITSFDSTANYTSKVWSDWTHGATDTYNNVAQDLVKKANNIVENVQKTASNFVRDPVQTVSNIVSSGWNGGVSAVSNIGQSAYNTISNVSNNIYQTGVDAYNGAKDFISNAWDNATSWASNTWNDVSNAVSNAWDSATSWVSDTYNNVTNWVSNTWNSAVDTYNNWAQDPIGNTANAIGSAYNWVADNVSNYVNENIIQPIQDVWNGASGYVSDSYNNASTWVQDTAQNVQNTWNDWGNNVNNAWNNWFGYDTVLQSLKPALAIYNLGSITTKAQDNTNSSGCNNTNQSSFWEGLGSTVTNLGNGVKSFYNGLSDTIKGQLDGTMDLVGNGINNITPDYLKPTTNLIGGIIKGGVDAIVGGILNIPSAIGTAFDTITHPDQLLTKPATSINNLLGGITSTAGTISIAGGLACPETGGLGCVVGGVAGLVAVGSGGLSILTSSLTNKDGGFLNLLSEEGRNQVGDNIKTIACTSDNIDSNGNIKNIGICLGNAGVLIGSLYLGTKGSLELLNKPLAPALEPIKPVSGEEVPTKSLDENGGNDPNLGCVGSIPNWLDRLLGGVRVRASTCIKDNDTVLGKSDQYTKTNRQYKGANIFKGDDGNYYYRDTFHDGDAFHIEVFDSKGKHLGEMSKNGSVDYSRADPSKTLPKDLRP